MKPTFLGIGAQRCATTWLFENLRLHPGVHLPAEKEINFFSSIGESEYRGSLSKYLKLFASARDRPAGEITPEYMVDPDSPSLILSVLGSETRILSIVRNPVERAFSAYAKGVRDGNWNCSFEAFVEQDMDLCITRGRYHRLLSRFLDRFEQVGIFVYEDLVDHPRAFLHSVLEFIGADAFDSRQLHSRFNVGVSERYAAPVLVVALRDVLYRVPGTRPLVKAVQRVPSLNRRITRSLMRGRGAVEPDLAMELRRVFAEDVDGLSRILDRDLGSEWFD